MPSQKNQDLLKDLTQKLNDSKSVVIADYSGLDSSAQTELRAKIAEAGGQLVVARNRIVKIALKDKVDTNNSDLDKALNGPNAFLFSYQDAVSALKAMFEFAKDNEALEIKLGLLDDKVLTYQETENLSKLPSKAELVAKLIGQIQAPVYGLVNVIQGPTRGLVYALNAIKQQKETNN